MVINYSGLLARLLACVLLASPLISAGEDVAGSSFPGLSLKGFGTLGAAHSDDGRAQFVRDLTQLNGLRSGWSANTDSVLGLQANAKFSDQTEVVIQATSRYRYDGTYKPELSWAFVRHDFSPDISLRLGRMGTEFYMLADSRLVGYANLTVRPPSDYYGPLVISHFDGLDASATTKLESGPLSGGLLRGKLFAGYAAEKAPINDQVSLDLNGSLLVGGYVEYLSGPWQVRLGRAQIRFKEELPLNQLAGTDIMGIAPELSIADKWTHYNSLGIVYDNGPLQIQSMYSQIGHDSAAYEDSWAAYVIAGYRVNQITPYLGYSRVKSRASSLTTPLPPQLVGQISQLTDLTHSDQHTISLGARWDFYQNLDLKAQIDFIRGTPQSVFPFRNAVPGWDGRMNVFSLTLDFVF